MATASSDEISPQFVNSFRPETFLQNIFFFREFDFIWTWNLQKKKMIEASRLATWRKQLTEKPGFYGRLEQVNN